MVNSGMLQLLGSSPGVRCVCGGMSAILAARELAVGVGEPSEKAKAPPGVLPAATGRVQI